MVQFCCGIGDCNSAGAGSRRIKRRSSKFGDVTVIELLDEEAVASGAMISFKLRNANGTIIEPAQISSSRQSFLRDAWSLTLPLLQRRRMRQNRPLRHSTAGVAPVWTKSWVPDAGKEDYTKPADHPQRVYDTVSGPSDITITDERSQSWTRTMEMSLGFADVISLGMSFQESYSETVTDSQAYAFHVPAGQKGKVGFTPYLECSTGMRIMVHIT
jgi:hypothetical protein